MDIIALTNALTDIVVKVSDEELQDLGLQKGTFNPLDKIDAKKLLLTITGKDISYLPAGSPANVIFNLSSLGLETGLIGTVGNDDIGNKYNSFWKWLICIFTLYVFQVF